MTGRRGFTLIEVIVALAVGGIVLAIGVETIAAVQSVATRATSLRHEADLERNAESWLRRAFASLIVGQGDADTFDGFDTTIEFSALLPAVAGPAVERRIVLEAGARGLTAAQHGRPPLILFPNVHRIECQYLMSYGIRSEWLRSWRSPATVPLAIRLILWRVPDQAAGSDTLLLWIGERA